jgi:hypothetical protein
VKDLTVMRELGKPVAIKNSGKQVLLPLDERRYIQFRGVTRAEVIAAFENAAILSN